jgi:hypothetical protein
LQADLIEGVNAAHAPSRDRKIRDRSALMALLLGIGLLWPLPTGGALLMVAGAFGLAISWEDGLVEARAEAHGPGADR